MKSSIKIICFAIILNFYYCEGCPDGCECEDNVHCSKCKTGYYDVGKNCTSSCQYCPGQNVIEMEMNVQNA